MTTDKEAKVSGMFRYGMRMELPARFNTLEYYGRGEVENYSDRKSCADLGHLPPERRRAVQRALRTSAGVGHAL